MHSNSLRPRRSSRAFYHYFSAWSWWTDTMYCMNCLPSCSRTVTDPSRAWSNFYAVGVRLPIHKIILNFMFSISKCCILRWIIKSNCLRSLTKSDLCRQCSCGRFLKLCLDDLLPFSPMSLSLESPPYQISNGSLSGVNAASHLVEYVQKDS